MRPTERIYPEMQPLGCVAAFQVYDMLMGLAAHGTKVTGLPDDER